MTVARTKRRLLLVLSWAGGLPLVQSCAARHSSYDELLLVARHHERQGQTEAAASGYRRAAAQGETEDEQAAALYYEAQALRRSPDEPAAEARLRDLVKTHPRSSSAPRALLDLGRMSERGGHRDEARATYLRVVSEYPRSAAAESAAAGYARLGPPPASASYRGLLEHQSPGRLDEFLRLRLGQALAEEGRWVEALAVLEGLARTYPLPPSTLADDALLLAAQLRRRLGDPQGSLQLFDVLLGQATSADMLGSYARKTYPEALWQKAIVLRDDLQDQRRAEEAFVELAQRFPQSLRADDALWQAAYLARARGDSGEACRHAESLITRVPPSRYRNCATLLCPRDTGVTPKDCQRHLTSIPERFRAPPSDP